MQNLREEFIKKLFGFSLGPFFSAIIGFLITPISTYLIIPEEFGKASMYTMALSLSSLFIYLGIDQAFVREYNAKEDKKNLLWNCFLIPFSFSIVIAIIYIIFYREISLLLFDSKEFFVMLILALSLPVAIFHRFNTLIIRMEEKAKLYSFISVVQRIVNLPLLLLFLLFYEKSFKSIVLAQFFSLLFIGIITFIINKRYWFFKIKIKRNLIIQVIKFGLPLVPASIFSWLLNSMDKVALRSWSSFNELGLYSAAFKIVTVLNIINTAFSTFWVPTSYRWYENNISNTKYEKVSHKLTTIFILLFGSIVLFKDYIIMILDKNYAESAVMVPFLLFLPIMYSVSITTGCGIEFKRKTVYQILVTGIAASVNFLGNFLLVPIYGGLGASISTGISFIVFFFVKTFISRKLWFEFDMKFYIINVILMLLMASVSVIIDSFIIEMLVFIILIIYNYSNIKYIFNLTKVLLKEIKNKIYKKRKTS